MKWMNDHKNELKVHIIQMTLKYFLGIKRPDFVMYMLLRTLGKMQKAILLSLTTQLTYPAATGSLYPPVPCPRLLVSRGRVSALLTFSTAHVYAVSNVYFINGTGWAPHSNSLTDLD